MAFTLETGAGVVDANSYMSVAAMRAYHLDRGRDLTAIADGTLQAALIKASEYIDKRFGRKFRGWKKSGTQGLEWPRNNAYDNDDFALDGLPSQLTKATAEYALRAHYLGILAPDPALPFSTRDATTGTGTTTTAGQVIESTDKVGPIEESKKFAEVGSSSVRVSTGSTLVDPLYLPPYPEADLWLEELLKSSGTRDMERG